MMASKVCCSRLVLCASCWWSRFSVFNLLPFSIQPRVWQIDSEKLGKLCTISLAICSWHSDLFNTFLSQVVHYLAVYLSQGGCSLHLSGHNLRADCQRTLVHPFNSGAIGAGTASAVSLSVQSLMMAVNSFRKFLINRNTI